MKSDRNVLVVLLRLPSGVFAVKRVGDALQWRYLGRPTCARTLPDQSGLVTLLRRV